MRDQNDCSTSRGHDPADGPRVATRRLRALLVAGAVALAVVSTAPLRASAAAAPADPGRFVTLDVPGAGTGPGLGTFPSGINSRGDIVGNWYDSNGFGHGFLHADGRFSPIDDPAAGTAPFEGTDPINISATGEVVGLYVDAGGAFHGFILRKGVFTTVDDPLGGTAANTGTILQGSNDRGTYSGLFGGNDGVHHAFIYRDGRFVTVNYSPFPSTFFGGMNQHGSIVGGYTDANSVHHAAVYRDGKFGPAMDDPHAGTGPNQGTDGFCITNGGVINGEYFDSSGVVHGYMEIGTTFRTVDDPLGVGGSTLQCLTDDGTGEGNWYGADGTSHGYIYHPHR